jgi:hypothetical protein
MSQVHKENLTAVDNALPNRAGLDIEIFGMEGIPEDIAQQHTQRVLTNFHQAQADRQGAAANAAQAGQNPTAPKKPKIESVSDIKKRLAEHKAAKLAAEKENGGSSGGSTPAAAAPAQAQPQLQAPPVSHLKLLGLHFGSFSCRPLLQCTLDTSNHMQHHLQMVRTTSLLLSPNHQLLLPHIKHLWPIHQLDRHLKLVAMAKLLLLSQDNQATVMFLR